MARRTAQERRLISRAGIAWAVLGLVGIGWGATGFLSKIATATGHGALMLTFWQTVIGVLCFTVAVALSKGRLPLGRRYLIFYAVCGFLGTALPHSLGFLSIRHLPVGVQTMTLSTVPMLTLLIALPLGLERWEARRALGIALGLAAMLMIALPQSSLPEPGQVFWLILPMLVAVSYAAENTVIATSRPADLSALQVMCGLSWAALAMLGPALLVAGETVLPERLGREEAALFATSLLHVASYLGFVWLIGQAGAVFAAQVGYVVTASGVLWGMAVFGERHSLWVWGALALVFTGLALVTPRQRAPVPSGGVGAG
ncbi:MAG: DMT family transporter [Pikeienuella sp.]